MKFLERFTLIIYSYVVIILSVILSLLIFNWMDIETITQMVEPVLTGEVSSKVVLSVCAVFILLSIKCIFFDEKSKEKIKESQGILLKNENGELMISKESIDNMVKNAVSEFDCIKECSNKISVNSENKIVITLYIVVNKEVILKDLASNIQAKVKEEVMKIADLEVQEVNIRVMNLQEESKKNKE